MLGAAFNWQHGGNQDSDLVGSANTDAGFFTYTADASWDLGGANLYGAFFGNFTSSLPDEGGNGNGSSIQSYGALVQGGYFISDNTELFASWQWYETVNQGGNGDMTDNNVFSGQMNNIFSAGVNVYLTKNVKFTFDAGWAVNGIVYNGGIYNQAVAGTNWQVSGQSSNGGEWVGRAQIQVVF